MISNDMRFASWNTLIEGWKIAAKPCLKDMPWEQRRELIVQRIVRMNVHVVCFQEIDRFNSLAEKMAQVGYYGVYAKRNNGQEEGCAIFYKHSEVCILKINDQEQVVHFFNDNTGRMIQKVAIQFLHKANAAPITFLNTHIVNVHSYGNIEEGFSRRTEELRQLIKHTVQASENGSPVIACGDFNVSTEWMDRPYLQGFRENGFIDSFDHSEHAHKPTVLFAGTHQTQGAATTRKRIDFAFSKNIQVLSSDVRGDPNNLDNVNEASDHLPIFCQYAIPDQAELLPIELRDQLASGNVKRAMEILEGLPPGQKERVCQAFIKTLSGL